MRTLFVPTALVFLCACSEINLSSSSDNLSKFRTQVLSDVSVQTKKNKPLTFQAGDVDGQRVGRLSFASSPGSLVSETPAGRYEIVDEKAYTIQFTPHEAFVGQDAPDVFATDAFDNALPGKVNMRVGNTLNTIQPALAVRGLSCITCHTQAASNIVTDYGHGSPWYFDVATGDSFYADRLGADGGLSTLNLMGTGNVIVPRGDAPAAIKSQFAGVSSLADFVRARFAQGTSNTATQVREIASLKISLPTAGRISSLFGNPTVPQVYLPDTQNSPALSGLVLVGGAYVVSDLTCDGDLFVDRPLVFSNATVRSLSGCRIYSTRSVFIDGPLASVSAASTDDHNVQILSATSVWMGGGRMIKDGVFCDRDGAGNAIGWYSGQGNTGGVDCQNGTNATNPRCDSLATRAYNTVIRNTFSEAFPSADALKGLLQPTGFDANSGGVIQGERALVEAGLGHPLFDASCGPAKRNVSYARLLLAAPYVNNRYSGDVSGSVIAEAAIMSLGSFRYEYDPVFKRASIFSLLDENELISGDF